MRAKTSAGGAIYYEVHGESASDAIVLIPGTSASHEVWRRQVERFKERYRVIAIDLRGAGQSDHDYPAEAYSIELLAADVLSVMDDAGLESAHLSGHSLGAPIAMRIAVDNPSRVRSLQLHAGWPRTDEYLRRIFFDVMMGALDRNDRYWTFKYGMGLIMSPEYLDTREPAGVAQIVTEVFVKNPYPASTNGFYGQLLAGRGHDMESCLGDLEVPTLAAVGELDANIPPRYSQRLAKLIPRCELHIFTGPRASHCVNIEMPDEFNAVCLGFMDRWN